MRPAMGRPGAADEETPLLAPHAGLRSQPVQQQSLIHVVNDDISFLTPAVIPPLPQDPAKDHVTVSTVCVDDDSDFGGGDDKIPPYSCSAEGTVEAGSTSPYLGGISRIRFWLVFGGICLNTFVATFDAILMASSHPVITSYFDASNSASWLSTSFLLTATSFQPLFGRASDYVGRRQPSLIALFIFAAATTWCALAPSVEQFIAARAFCGFGAGGIMLLSSILVNDLTPLETRGTYQAWLNLSFGFGSAGGAAFGGFLCEHIGWRWTFGMQVPFIFLTFAVGLLTIPSRLGPCHAYTSEKNSLEIFQEFDVAGSFLLATSIALFVLGINLGGNIVPWTHPFVVGSLVLSLVATIALIYVEKRAWRPVMPLSIFSKKPQSNLILNNTLAAIGINIIMFNAPLYFNAVKLESASSSGLRLMAPSVAVTIFGCFSGFAITATGRITWLVVAGSVFMLVGGIGMSAMWHGIPAWLATVFIVPVNMGQGLSFPASCLGVLVTSSQEDQAVVTSMLTLGRSLGVVLGVALSSGILENALEHFLNNAVAGPDKAAVVLRVRKSVHAIFTLPPDQQAQAIYAYEESLRWTFISSIVIFLLAIWLLVPVRLPKLGRSTAALAGYGSME